MKYVVMTALAVFTIVWGLAVLLVVASIEANYSHLFQSWHLFAYVGGSALLVLAGFCWFDDGIEIGMIMPVMFMSWFVVSLFILGWPAWLMLDYGEKHFPETERPPGHWSKRKIKCGNPFGKLRS